MLAVTAPAQAQGASGQDGVLRITAKNGKVLQILDTRGEGEQSGIMAASSASDHGVVVLLVRGRDQGIIDAAKNAMLALLQMGYERIGLILTDENFKDGTTKQHITVLSRGLDAGHIRDAGPHAATETAIIRLMRQIYDHDLGSHKAEKQ